MNLRLPALLLAATAFGVLSNACFLPVDELVPHAPESDEPDPPHAGLCAGCNRDAGKDAGTQPNTDGGVLTHLHFPIHESAAFSDGQRIWSLGGSTSNNVKQSLIFSLAPATGAVTSSSVSLPNAEAGAYFAAKGSVIYLFGGDTGNGLLRSIVKFDASTQTVTTMNAQLPTARYKGGAAWVGSSIYLFGGWNGTSTLQEILRYDTVNDAISEIPSNAELRREQSAAFALGGFIYIVSGNVGVADPKPSVVRFDPITHSLTTLTVSNPAPLAFTGSASDDRYGYLFGGLRSDWTPTGAIIRFDPVAQRFDQVGQLAKPKHGDPWVRAENGFVGIGGMNVPEWTWHNVVQFWRAP